MRCNALRLTKLVASRLRRQMGNLLHVVQATNEEPGFTCDQLSRGLACNESNSVAPRSDGVCDTPEFDHWCRSSAICLHKASTGHPVPTNLPLPENKLVSFKVMRMNRDCSKETFQKLV